MICGPNLGHYLSMHFSLVLLLFGSKLSSSSRDDERKFPNLWSYIYWYGVHMRLLDMVLQALFFQLKLWPVKPPRIVILLWWDKIRRVGKVMGNRWILYQNVFYSCRMNVCQWLDGYQKRRIGQYIYILWSNLMPLTAAPRFMFL